MDREGTSIPAESGTGGGERGDGGRGRVTERERESSGGFKAVAVAAVSGERGERERASSIQAGEERAGMLVGGRKEDGEGGALREVVKCDVALCGKFYHADCLSPWLDRLQGLQGGEGREGNGERGGEEGRGGGAGKQGSGPANEEVPSLSSRPSAEQRTTGSGSSSGVASALVCPLHSCYECGGVGEMGGRGGRGRVGGLDGTGGMEGEEGDERLVPCRRCPKAYHVKCVPAALRGGGPGECDQVGGEGRGGSVGVSAHGHVKRVWGLHGEVEQLLMYCDAHELEEGGWTPAWSHHKWPAGVEMGRGTGGKKRGRETEERYESEKLSTMVEEGGEDERRRRRKRAAEMMEAKGGLENNVFGGETEAGHWMRWSERDDAVIMGDKGRKKRRLMKGKRWREAWEEDNMEGAAIMDDMYRIKSGKRREGSVEKWVMDGEGQGGQEEVGALRGTKAKVKRRSDERQQQAMTSE